MNQIAIRATSIFAAMAAVVILAFAIIWIHPAESKRGGAPDTVAVWVVLPLGDDVAFERLDGLA